MRGAFAIAALMAGHGAFVATHAAAAAPLPLEYSAPAGCLDRAAFLREVSQRLPRSAGKVQSVRVVIKPVADEFVARLEVVDASGATAEREINGAHCKDVSSAMALVVALVLTELAGQEQTLPAPGPARETNPKPPAQSAAPAPVAAEAPAPNGPSKGPAMEFFPGPDAVRTDSGSARAIPFETGLMATATAGIAPALAWGGWGYVEIGDFARPAARLNLGARTTVSVERGPGTARFDWFGGRLDGCWPLLAYGAKIGVAGCATFEAAVLRGHGADIDNPDSSLDSWFALGLLLRPGVRTGDFVIQAELGPSFPLVRRKFVFGTENAPESTIYEIPDVSWHVGVGAGVRL